MAGGQIPEDFVCPISLEIMSDPVILSSGHTFDRSSIQRWLDAGHRSCPITKLPLSSSPNLIPNHALRSLISNFTHLKPQPPHYPSNPNPQSLISSLTSPSSSSVYKLNSLDQLTHLSKRDSSLRRRLTESGAASAVLGCISSNDAVLQQKALNLLLNLSLDDDNKVGLVAEGAIDTVIAVLRGGGGSCRAVAATILTSLAVVDVNKATIGAYPFAISGLISMLGVGNGREKKEAATALFTVCSFVDNRRRAVECGAVPVLVSAAELGIERAVEVLGLLAKCKEGREEMGRFSECLRVLVNVVKEGSGRGVLYALITMNSLCCYSEGMCGEVIREGVFEVCLGLLENDNDKVRRNAESLVQILRGKRGGGGGGGR